MPQYNRRELDARAREYGFNRDTFEKVLRLRTILEFLNTQVSFDHIIENDNMMEERKAEYFAACSICFWQVRWRSHGLWL